jgi:molecular chaperone Hsp33
MPNTSETMPHRVSPRGDEDHDELVRTISGSGGIAVKAVIANGLLSEAVSLRPHAATAGNALGRAMIGALLVAVGSAADDADDSNVESVQVQIRGDGPLGSLTAIADSRARVRGTVQRPGIELIHEDGTPNIAKAVGLGVINVVRHRPRWRSPYTGTVPLVSGVAGAGFLVQAMPGAGDSELARVEANVAALPGLATLLEAPLRADDLIDRLLEGLGSRERHATKPTFFCPCTRERATRTLSLLERAELEELVAATETQEVVCDFCGRGYQIPSDEIAPLLEDY